MKEEQIRLEQINFDKTGKSWVNAASEGYSEESDETIYSDSEKERE